MASDILIIAPLLRDENNTLLRHLEAHGEIAVPAFKARHGLSRKHAIPLLEYFDRIGVTRRSGEVRVLAK